MNDNVVCWKCGASIENLPFPLSRLATCAACHAELHVCMLCRFYDTSRANHCQEPIAEPVKDKRRANFCELFQVRADAYCQPASDKTHATQRELSALFGEDVSAPVSVTTADHAKSELDKLFGLSESQSSDKESDPDKDNNESTT